MTKRLFLSITLSAIISMAAFSQSSTEKALGLYSEPHRLQFHYSPQAHWMNDPNGMFYYQGEYHLFYQHYPEGIVWGPMHWGHAVSKDLVHWEELPIALYPDSLGYIFSGSAVVDLNNTSGLGSKENPPIVAIFTYHDANKEKAGRKDYQYQGIAYSLDKGRTWTKYKENPVLPNQGVPDFRDPKVAWNEESKKWIMTLAVKDHIEFYGSPDLKNWSKLSEFGKEDGGHGGVWECPDLIKLKDDKGVEKYVLLVSINPGAPNGGSGTQYFVGSFDGKTFKSDTPGKNAGWMDYGTDNYAGVTFSNIPKQDGREILMGWMTNWAYAQNVPTERWRSAMTIPRRLTLKTYNNGYILVSEPVKELDKLVVAKQAIKNISPNENISSRVDFPISTSVVEGVLDSKDFTIELSNSKDQKLVVGFDSKKNQFYIDRSKSGKNNFSKDFFPVMSAPRNSKEQTIKFTAIIDVASIEVFFDNGATVMTSLFFPDEKFSQLKINGPSKVKSLQIDKVKSIWSNIE